MNTLDLSQHTKDDLSLMIELIEKERKELELDNGSLHQTISGAEDMSEGLEASFRQTIAYNRNRLETLYAWRMVFLNAWTSASKHVKSPII